MESFIIDPVSLFCCLMSSQVATPKQTGGGGFVFEDKVVSYYLLWMLAGANSFPQTPGLIARLDCQTRVDGWLLDDLLLTFADSGATSRHAFSLKSGIQFPGATPPADFVRSAWGLALHDESSVFDGSVDRLGLIAVPNPEPQRGAIQSLLRKARAQTPEQLAARINTAGYASESERSLFDGFDCPKDLATKHGAGSRVSGRLLRTLSVIELDFEHADSQSEATALFMCQHLVTSGAQQDAAKLWDALCQIGNRLRISGGGITREELLSEVRRAFELRDAPDFASDWQRLRESAEAEMAAIPDTIGGTVRISRDTLLGEILSAKDGSPLIAIIGESGSGKSVAAKSTVQACRNAQVVWMNAGRLRPGYIESLATHLGLTHPLALLLRNGRCSSGLIVIDQSERLVDDDDFKEAALLLQSAGFDKRGCIWRVILTCQAEHWERVQLGLARHLGHADITPIRATSPAPGELEAVWSEYPALGTLAIRPHLTELLRNLKLLDMLAWAIRCGQNPESSALVGETHLIGHYWQGVVRTGTAGAARAVLLQRLAAREADDGVFETPEVELSADELALAAGMQNVLRTDVRRGVVLFTHDLLSDWARFYGVLSHEETLGAYLENKSQNPRWHRAIRLYAVHLLDSDPTAARWKAALSSLDRVGDLFLEALIFAANSRRLLESTWGILVADKGELLGRLLRRFLHVATIPNPDHVDLATKANIPEAEARTWERLPLWIYWLGLLACLAEHADEAVALRPVEIATLARTWLRYTPIDWLGRKQAAALALASGWHALRTQPYYRRSDSDGLMPYRAALAAYREIPEEVKDFALKAASRVKPVPQDGELFEEEPPPEGSKARALQFGLEDDTPIDPWPDGPFFSVTEAFQIACLETDALRDLMIENPALASEIILALLIKVRVRAHHMSDYFPEDRMALNRDRRFYPRFYTQGPFLMFLRLNPDEGLKLVCRLLNFATTRWMDSNYDGDARDAGFDLELAGQTKRFVGDDKVFHWYHGSIGSDILMSALMAVEKWLYDLIDQKLPVDGWIQSLLGSCDSIAIVGMLSEVGRYHPMLLTGSLMPLILVPNTYYHETAFTIQGGHAFGTPVTLREGERFWNLARAWDSMPHRPLRLIDLASWLFRNHEETRQALIAARDSWKSMEPLGNPVLARHRAVLIATFDEHNWKAITLPDGRQAWEFVAPQNLVDSPEQLAKGKKTQLLLTRPLECRTRIDKANPLPEEQIETFISATQSLADFVPDDPEIPAIAPYANTACGTAAVLLLLHGQWLQNHPGIATWCLQQIENALMRPPPSRPFDLPQSIGSHDWEHFSCEAIPLIVAGRMTDPKWLAFLARLAMAKHYSAAGLLMRSAFAQRAVLGQIYWQLVRLTLDWAAIRHGLKRVLEDDAPDASGWQRTAIERFALGTYESDVPPWGEQCFAPAAPRNPAGVQSVPGTESLDVPLGDPQLDCEQIHHVFDRLFLPNQAADDAERKLFLAFWDQALLVSLARARAPNHAGEDVDTEAEPELPADFDYWVLDQVALVVAQMRPDEDPRRYWGPILDLGPRAESWVGHFLDHFIMALKAKPIDSCRLCWFQMFEYCSSLPAWNDPSGTFSFRMPSLWMSLMGFPNYVRSLWSDEDAELIGTAGAYLTLSAPRVLHDKHHAVRFVHWLSEASAALVRLELLEPLCQSALSASKYWWGEPHMALGIARYLLTLWESHRSELQSQADRKQLFLDLLHKVSSTQEPLAMELQARVAEGR